MQTWPDWLQTKNAIKTHCSVKTLKRKKEHLVLFVILRM